LKEKLSGVIVADITFVGRKEKNKHFHEREGRSKPGGKGKIPVFSLVERGGKVRSIVMDKVTAPNLRKAITENAELSSRLMTDLQSADTHMGRLSHAPRYGRSQGGRIRASGRDSVMVSTNRREISEKVQVNTPVLGICQVT
jgi:hypothetical protein